MRRLRQLLLLSGLLAALLSVSGRAASGWADRRVELVVGMGSVRRLAVGSGKTPAQVAEALRTAGVGGLWLPEDTPARLAAEGRVSLLAGSRWRDIRRAVGAGWPAGLPVDATYLLVGAHHPNLARLVVDGLNVTLGAHRSIRERLVGGTLAIGVDRSPVVVGPLPLGFGSTGLALAHQTGLTAIPVVQLPPAGMGSRGVRSLFAGLATAAAPVHTLAVSPARLGRGAAAWGALTAMGGVWQGSGWTLAVPAGRPGTPLPGPVAALRRRLGGSVGVYRVPAAWMRARRPPVARVVAAVQERGAGWVYLDLAAVGSGDLATAVSWSHAVASGLWAAGYRRAPPLPLPLDRPALWLRLFAALAVVGIGWSIAETLWPGRPSPWYWTAAGGLLGVVVVARPGLADGVAVLALAGGAGLAAVRAAERWPSAGASVGRSLVVALVAAGWSGAGLLVAMSLAPAARGTWVAVILAALVALAAAPRWRTDARTDPVGGGMAVAVLALTTLSGVLLAWGAAIAVVGAWGRFALLVAGWPLLLAALVLGGHRRQTAGAWRMAVAAGLAVWARGFVGLPPLLALRREALALAVGLALGSLLWAAARARGGRSGRRRPAAGGTG